MTGFGDANAAGEGVHCAVEVRSLNNRYFKAMIRLPDEISGLEAELESLLRQRINRGSVTIKVTVRLDSAAAAYSVNEAALRQYLEQAEHLTGGQVEVGAMLALPGVLQPPVESGLLDQVRPLVTRLVDQACGKLDQMRRAEGEGLDRDLRGHLELIEARLQTILERAPTVVETYQDRLQQRVRQMLADAEIEVNQVDLIKEVAVFADKVDIAEEAQRIRAHLARFAEILDAEDDQPAGRTLDFVAQELLREANTIASKSNDGRIARDIVDVKGAIDRIKEQVQNVE